MLIWQCSDRCHAIRGQQRQSRTHSQRSSSLRTFQRGQRTRECRLACAAAAAPAECTTAREAVLSGTEAFKRGEAARALQLYARAMDLKPDKDEARSATYNAACAHAKLKQWQLAADAVVQAVNEHGLRLNVAVQDDDLRALRERREWLDVLEVAKGGVTSQALVRARSETRAPFRPARLFLAGGLSLGAALGLFIIAGRLVSALRGGEGAPDLTETLTNFTVNSLALAGLAWVFSRDLAAQQRDSTAVGREEALGRLLVRVGKRELPLASFRGRLRVVVLAGGRGYVKRALERAGKLRRALEARGVALLPLELSPEDSGASLKELKAQLALEERGGKGFGDPAAQQTGPVQASPVAPADREWELRPAQEGEWREWLKTQREAAGVKSTDIYFQVQLDGRVRTSGSGNPPFDRWLEDLPPLDDVRTKFGDGLGL